MTPGRALGSRLEPPVIGGGEMTGRFTQQQGLLQLGEIAIAFVFPVCVVETDEAESEQEATAT